MQERQVQPVKNEELYEKFKEAIIGFEHDAQQSITGLSNKCLGIAERYAASKLNNTIEDKWISVEDELPKESGRYWCYVEHQTDLGLSHFQWNCSYNEISKTFSDRYLTDGERVTHWQPLPKAPKK